jgi:hypothetical protein
VRDGGFALCHDEDRAADTCDQILKAAVLNQPARSGQNEHASPLLLCDVDEWLDIGACYGAISGVHASR